MVDVAGNLKVVRDKIIAASARRKQELQYFEPRLVAATKIKPPLAIIAAYEEGQREFGENYVNELCEKGSNPSILEKCKEIQWHFIGHLQRNKVNKVLKVPNLYMVETVDSVKLANALDTAWPKFRRDDSKLKVLVQVNTSKEDAKMGCAIEEALSIVKYVINNCNNLEFEGLMTIGRYGYDPSKGLNPDYLLLIKCREDIAKELNMDVKKIELSMGMSNDYEQAIEMGSTMVRVGQSIFGPRPKINVNH